MGGKPSKIPSPGPGSYTVNEAALNPGPKYTARGKPKGVFAGGGSSGGSDPGPGSYTVLPSVATSAAGGSVIASPSTMMNYLTSSTWYFYIDQLHLRNV